MCIMNIPTETQMLSRLWFQSMWERRPRKPGIIAASVCVTLPETQGHLFSLLEGETPGNVGSGAAWPRMTTEAVRFQVASFSLNQLGTHLSSSSNELLLSGRCTYSEE